MLCSVGEEVGLDMVDSLVDGDAGSGVICVSCRVVCRVQFIATRCASNCQYMVNLTKMVLECG